MNKNPRNMPVKPFGEPRIPYVGHLLGKLGVRRSRIRRAPDLITGLGAVSRPRNVVTS